MLGFSASTICAIHCALIPVILLFLPLIGLEFFTDPIIEIALIGISLVIGIYTLRSGYLKHHGRIYPTVLFIIGLAIIVWGHFFIGHDLHEGHVDELTTLSIIGAIVIPVGAIMIAIAHYMNRKMCLSCTLDHDHGEEPHSHDYGHAHHHHEHNQQLETTDVV